MVLRRYIPRKAGEREDLANARNRIQQMKRIRIVLFSVAQDFQLDLVEQIVVETDPLQIEGDTGPDARIGKAFSDTFTIAPLRDLLSDFRKVVLVVRVLDVGQQLGALPHQVHTASQ